MGRGQGELHLWGLLEDKKEPGGKNTEKFPDGAMGEDTGPEGSCPEQLSSAGPGRLRQVREGQQHWQMQDGRQS